MSQKNEQLISIILEGETIEMSVNGYNDFADVLQNIEDANLLTSNQIQNKQKIKITNNKVPSTQKIGLRTKISTFKANKGEKLSFEISWSDKRIQIFVNYKQKTYSSTIGNEVSIQFILGIFRQKLGLDIKKPLQIKIQQKIISKETRLKSLVQKFRDSDIILDIYQQESKIHPAEINIKQTNVIINSTDVKIVQSSFKEVEYKKILPKNNFKKNEQIKKDIKAQTCCLLI